MCWITFWSWIGHYPLASLFQRKTNVYCTTKDGLPSSVRPLTPPQFRTPSSPGPALTSPTVYGTTWVGETYYRASPDRAAELRSSHDVVGDIARRGSIALVLFSVISFAGSVILPFVVSSPSEDDESSSTKAVPKRMASLATMLRPYQPDITTAWGLSQVAFGASMILAPISHSFRFATTLIALCGMCDPPSSFSFHHPFNVLT